MIMQIRLPREIETDQYATVVLDDGRRVSMSGDGRIYVYGRPDQLGNEDYSLELPSVTYIAQKCDNREGRLGHGHVTITVEHRH
jgi:hypothetical protein